VINGELWGEETESIPVCVECHQPHKARKVFYDEGVADRDCLMCHAKIEIRSLWTAGLFLWMPASSRIRCIPKSPARGVTRCLAFKTAGLRNDQGESELRHLPQRQAGTISEKHHGIVRGEGSSDARSARTATGRTVFWKERPGFTFLSINVPRLCAGCHQENQKAAVRYKGTQRTSPNITWKARTAKAC